MNPITLIFQQTLTELPTIIVCLGAIVTACVFWQRAPFSSLFVILGCSLTFVILVFWSFAYEAVVQMFGSDPETTQKISIAFRIFWSVIRAIAILLLVIAVYAGRHSKK